MKSKLAASVATFLMLSGVPAWAHRIDEYLQATILSLDPSHVHASMRLIPGVMVAPSVIAAIDSNHDGFFSESEKRAYADRVLRDLSVTIDGEARKPEIDSWLFPNASQLRDGLGEIHIEYHVDLTPETISKHTLILSNYHLNKVSVYLVNVEVPQHHDLRVLDQKRNLQQSVYELDYEQDRIVAVNPGAQAGIRVWWNGLQFSSLFHLGMRHIAEGTDHLLFLLVLLLPAPLLVVGSRWDRPATTRQSLVRIIGIVTAFTIGHSLTLSLAAMNFVHVSGQLVEILIAVSILVSAVHAFRPIFVGREAWIAMFFGLIHGLAFATTLDRLGLSRWTRVEGILSFNLGIETMQLLVVALILPSLLLLSRTQVYPAFRIGGATFGFFASAMWLAERLLKVQTPVDAVVNVIAERGIFCAVVLFATSVACVLFAKRTTS